MRFSVYANFLWFVGNARSRASESTKCVLGMKIQDENEKEKEIAK